MSILKALGVAVALVASIGVVATGMVLLLNYLPIVFIIVVVVGVITALTVALKDEF